MTTVSSTTELISFNPATGAAVGGVPVTSPADVAAVVEQARDAQLRWAQQSLQERISLLRSATTIMKARKDTIAAALTAEMGKPFQDALGELTYGIDGYEAELDEIAQALAPETHEDERTRTTLYRDPLGVCAAITPWNFPFLMPLQVVVPALAAGNSVVMKPSEETPLTGQAFADIFMEVLPPDVMQIIHGGDDQGKALVRAQVDLIAFVGSREAGQHILSTAAADLKRVVLELGGKDPMIVLSDADLESAADFAVTNSFRNCGQVCVSTERIYVEDSIAEAFEQAIIDRTKALTIGDGKDEGVNIGPMINARQKETVLTQLARAKDQGATVAWGDTPADGNFVVPTVLTNLTHDMDIMREETFGPIACIMRVADEQEAIALANDTPFGLGAAVYGTPERASAVARRLTAGMIGVNKGCAGASGTPWVGAQQSGYGFHSGLDGHRQFTQVRLVSQPR